MPMIDYPLDVLKAYQGISPLPSDFDEYWNASLEEMRSTESNLELIRSDFQVPFADCFDLYFTGVRQARIHAKFIRPKGSMAPYPAIIQFHGYTDYSGDWSEKLKYVAAGFAVFALDCRGQGGLSEDTGGVKGNTHHGHFIRGLKDEPQNLLFRHIFLDCAQLAELAMVMPEIDESRIGVYGGSQGGALALVCASLVPGIKKVVALYPFLSDFRRVWEMDLAEDAYKELRTYFRYFDPQHQNENEIFNKLGYIDVQNFANRIEGHVLFASGLMDKICPPSTQFATYNKILSTKDLVVYPDYAHELLPGFNDLAFNFLINM